MRNVKISTYDLCKDQITCPESPWHSSEPRESHNGMFDSLAFAHAVHST